jgi:pilus assembly protein Flp/PilA
MARILLTTQRLSPPNVRVDNKKSFYSIFIQGEIIMLFAAKEKGQGLVEYALILVLVAIVVIVVLALLGPAIGQIFSNIMDALNGTGA